MCRIADGNSVSAQFRRCRFYENIIYQIQVVSSANFRKSCGTKNGRFNELLVVCELLIINEVEIVNRKNICTTLFNRQIGDCQNSFNYWYWHSKIEKDFGLKITEQIDQRDYHLLYQNHYQYCEFLKSAIVRVDSIRPQDIIQFLRDKNIGNGKIQGELLKIILSKSGAYEACCYLDSFQSSALSYAAVLSNKQCFILIKNKILANDESMARRLLTIEDVSGKNPINYFHQETQVNDFIRSDINIKGDQLYMYALQGNADLLASAIDSLGNKAKDACLQSQDIYKSNILHAVAQSGSIECLNLIIKTMGKDIEHLYIKDLCKVMPSYNAATYGSLRCMRAILQLSPFSLQNECFDENGLPSQLIDRVIDSNSFSKIQFILSILQDHMNIIDKYYSCTVNGINLIQSKFNSSAVSFFLLKEHISFDKDSQFMRNFTQDSDNIPFTLYCAIKSHLHELRFSKKQTM